MTTEFIFNGKTHTVAFSCIPAEPAFDKLRAAYAARGIGDKVNAQIGRANRKCGPFCCGGYQDPHQANKIDPSATAGHWRGRQTGGGGGGGGGGISGVTFRSCGIAPANI